MDRRPFARAAVQAAKLFVVMALGSAGFILLSLLLSPVVHSPLSTSPSSPPLLPGVSYSVYQVLLHVVTGFLAGVVSLDPAVALVGATVGPMVDLDHLGYFAGLPVEARVAHSFLFVAMMMLVDWRLHLWSKGTRNFFLFICLEFSLHLAVAPPGFPLFAPVSEAVVYFPRVVPAALAAVFASAFYLDSMKLRRETSLHR